MHWRQILAVAISVALNALDGFDVLAITFAAPTLSREWAIGPAELGVALSSGLAGMALGSLFLAPLGDRWGRRPLVLGCLAIMAAGMIMTATAADIATLSIWRVVTGLGIGGMVATINAVAAEFANERRRDLSVALMTVGYPIGGLIGGFAVADLVVAHGWRSIFIAGGIATAAFLPLVWFGLPESLEFLARRGTARAKAKLESILHSMRHPVPANLAPVGEPERAGSVVDLFGPLYRRLTIALVAAYFLHMMTFYFFSGWLPKVISDLGYATPDAVRTSALMSMGGVLGGAALGWAAPRLGLLRLVALGMVGTSVSFAAFAVLEELQALQATAFVAGICVFGGIVGLYSLLARAFPAALRVTGTGFAIGIGRGGSVLGPIVGGLLIQAGASARLAILVVGLGGVMAALILLAARSSLQQPEPQAINSGG